MKAYNELLPNQLDFSKVNHKHRALRIKQFAQWIAGELLFDVAEAYSHWLDLAVERGEVTFVGPGLFKKAVNLGKAIGQQVKTPGFVSDEVFTARLAQCKANICGLFDATNTKCKHPTCGCSMNVKARWASQNCPVYLWKD